MREPICPWCRKRHPYGAATAYCDDEGLWRCGRCAALIDVDGDCANPSCCGFTAADRRVEDSAASYDSAGAKMRVYDGEVFRTLGQWEALKDLSAGRVDWVTKAFWLAVIPMVLLLLVGVMTGVLQ